MLRFPLPYRRGDRFRPRRSPSNSGLTSRIQDRPSSIGTRSCAHQQAPKYHLHVVLVPAPRPADRSRLRPVDIFRVVHAFAIAGAIRRLWAASRPIPRAATQLRRVARSCSRAGMHRTAEDSFGRRRPVKSCNAHAGSRISLNDGPLHEPTSSRSCSLAGTERAGHTAADGVGAQQCSRFGAVLR